MDVDDDSTKVNEDSLNNASSDKLIGDSTQEAFGQISSNTSQHNSLEQNGMTLYFFHLYSNSRLTINLEKL